MSTDSPEPPRPLPDRPDLRHLKDQAKDLLEAGAAASLTQAQFKIARLYGFASWPKLKVHVESLQQIAQLKQAIDSNDVDRVRELMTRNPELHRAPLGYGKDGPLTWVAECRVPRERPGPARLALAKWMLENGSDVHQGGDGPLARAALSNQRIPMLELLVSHGADVNALWHGRFPILFAPCESVQAEVVQWLLDHGANPNCNDPGGQVGDTALDYVIGSYVRTPELGAVIDLLIEAGGVTRYGVPGVLALLRGRLDLLIAALDDDGALLHRRFPELAFGTTGTRRLTLAGATLLHVAAEFGDLTAAKLLLDRGADVNAKALIGGAGIGGQTAIFHAATQFDDAGLPMVRLLMERGADLSVRARLPGHYERETEVVECTPLGYARLFPGGASPSQTVRYLQEHEAAE